MSWGTAFEGLSAFATVGALVAAVVAALQAKRLFKIESARDELAKESARREHATQISAWAAMRILQGGTPVYGIVVRNASQDPAYEVRASCHGFTEDQLPALQCLPPGEYFVANRPVRRADGKVEQWDYAKPRGEIGDPVRPFTASDEYGVDVLLFRDHAGVDWVRSAKGALQPAPLES